MELGQLALATGRRLGLLVVVVVHLETALNAINLGTGQMTALMLAVLLLLMGAIMPILTALNAINLATGQRTALILAMFLLLMGAIMLILGDTEWHRSSTKIYWLMISFFEHKDCLL